MDSVDYSKGAPPSYVCFSCGAHGVKLWRQYATSAVELKCAQCLILENPDCEDTPKYVSEIGADGIWRGQLQRTDQIASHVPAVPDEEGVSFWGYSSVPQKGSEWWRRLPTHSPVKLDHYPLTEKAAGKDQRIRGLETDLARKDEELAALKELLAVCSHDGGHYAELHGITRACRRAKLIVVGERQESGQKDQRIRSLEHINSRKVYFLKGVAILEKTLEPVALYYPAGMPGLVFVRPMSEFSARFKELKGGK